MFAISASHFIFFLNSISSNIIELRSFFRLPSNSRNLINTRLTFLVPLSMNQGQILCRCKDEDLTDTTCYKTEKRGKKFLYICMIHLKLTVKKKTQEKKVKKDDNNKKRVSGIRTYIHENRWLLVYTIF